MSTGVEAVQVALSIQLTAIKRRSGGVHASIWNFLKDNQAILSWIGGGIAAVAAGSWAVVKFVAKNSD
jgi:hypothetical protein